jgi:hypothetical protein
MKRARSYPAVVRHWYRPVEHACAACHRTLRQAKTLSKRTVIVVCQIKSFAVYKQVAPSGKPRGSLA